MGKSFEQKAARALQDICSREIKTERPVTYHGCLTKVRASYHLKQQGDSPDVYACRVFDACRVQLEQTAARLSEEAKRGVSLTATIGERLSS